MTQATMAEAADRLIASKDFAAAEALLEVAIGQFPQDRGIAVRHARAAEQRHDWNAAVARWHAAAARFPADGEIARALSAAYVLVGLPDQADIALTDTLRAMEAAGASDESMRKLLIEQARLAAHRGDRDLARSRWQVLMRMAPDDPAVRRGWREAGGGEVPPAADGQRGPLAPEPGAPAPHAPLLLRFEGLGGTCEFGLVQRHFGAEPLGLFRWVSLRETDLCTALEDRLAGIGDPRFTMMTVGGAREFSTSDSRYGLGMHTFIKDVGQDREKLLGQLRRRMRFLRDKLLEDLTAGEKIFVYRHMRNAAERDFGRLLAALRAFNPANRLMVIRMLPHGAAGEKLALFAPGAACGAIADGRRPAQGGWAIDTATWLETCQHAEQILAG